MNKRLMIILLLGLLVLPMVSSEIEVFKQGVEADMRITCINNQTYCSNSATCNITIIDPNNVLLVNNQQTGNQGSYHNYTFNETLSKDNGEYIRKAVCVDGGRYDYGSDTFIITPTGNAFDDPSSFTTSIILIVMFGVTLFFLIYSKQTVNPGVQLFFNLIGYLTMTLTVGAGWILLQSAGVQSNLNVLMKTLMYIIGFVLMVIMYYVFINSTKQALKLWKSKRGFDDGEDYEF